MTRRADSERTALYAAELVAFDGTDLEMPLGHDVVAAQMWAVVTGKWWPGPAVEIRRARADALASSTRTCVESGIGSPVVIRLADEQTTVATAAHELARCQRRPWSGVPNRISRRGRRHHQYRQYRSSLRAARRPIV